MKSFSSLKWMTKETVLIKEVSPGIPENEAEAAAGWVTEGWVAKIRVHKVVMKEE